MNKFGKLYESVMGEAKDLPKYYIEFEGMTRSNTLKYVHPVENIIYLDAKSVKDALKKLEKQYKWITNIVIREIIDGKEGEVVLTKDKLGKQWEDEK